MTPERPNSERHSVDNGAGFRLALRRTRAARDPAQRPRGERARPLLIVPGYGMNSFIFSFHPRGPSLEATLAARGIEVWSVDLRGQGDTVAYDARDPHRYGLEDLARVDVGAAVHYVQRHTGSRVDVLGASLGTSLVLGLVAMEPRAPVGSVVSLAGVVTWVKVPALVRLAFGSPWVVGHLPFRGTRRLAGVALPTLARLAPSLMSVYLHPQSTDVADTETLIRTVEDPNRHVNREIAEWIAHRELVLGGVNVSRALAAMRHPLLCVVAMQDGIVPPETARAVFDGMGSDVKELVLVGTPDAPIAHADLFLATGAQEKVFSKVADFLLAQA